MKTIYFDCYSGISGDMTVGALIDAGADFEAIKEGLKSLGVEGYQVTAEKIVKKGIHATQFRVVDTATGRPFDHQPGHDEGHHHHHDHDHGHEHHHHCHDHDHDHDHEHGHSHGEGHHHHHDHGHHHHHNHDHDHHHDHDHGLGHHHHHDHDHGHDHGHHHHDHGHHHHPHRHLAHIEALISNSSLPDPVKEHAIGTFRALGHAEASVHGTTIDKVHFHEVGAVDSIVDIVAANLGFHLLGIERFVCSALHVGYGTVRCDHGIMPVPAPATARLLQNKPTYGGSVEGELVTPTGAALIDHRVTEFGPAPLIHVQAIGYGAGTRELPDRANVLRVLVGESDAAVAAGDTVHVLEANLDDMSGELLAPLLGALMDGGALDVFLTPVVGKKGRPAHKVTVLSTDASVQRLSDLLFTHSTTLGVRMRTERRVVLDRSWRSVSTPWGPVRVKIGSRGDNTISTAPEYEDCLATATGAGVPVRKVYEAALAAAVKGEFVDA